MIAERAMSPQAAQEIIANEFVAGSSPRPCSLADYLTRIGVLSDADLEKITNYQKNKRVSFAKAALALGLIDKGVLEYGLGVRHGFLRETEQAARVPGRITVGRNPYSKAATPFHQIRSRILAKKSTARKSFAISSVDRELDGAAFAANLAASMAVMGKNTLLIDLDFQQSPLAAIFGDAHAPGLMNSVDEKSALARIAETMFTNVDLLAAGDKSSGVNTTLSQFNISKLVSMTEQKYDYVFVNTPAASAPSDREMIWLAVPDVIALMRKNATKISDVESFRQAVRATGGDIYAALLGE